MKRFISSGQSMRAFAIEAGIPASTLALDVKRSRAGLGGFLDKRSRNGRRAELDDRSLTWTLAFLATRRRATLAAAWRELQPVATAHGWKYPTYGQLCRGVGKLPADARELMVYGSRHLFEKWGIVQRKESSSPNELWQIDATQLSVWVLDMESGEQIQPWAIGIIDCCTRVVLGMHVTKTAPTTADLLLALRNAMLPKKDDRFPYFGVPRAIQADNGSIFKCDDYLDMLLRLGIERVQIANDCPSANGKVERFFRTVEDQFLRQLSTYTHQYRGLAAAKARPVPWPAIQRLTDRFLGDYHLRNHRSLGKSPWEAWHDALHDAHGLGLVSADVVDACKVRAEKTVARDGIEISPGRHLSAPELAGLIGEHVILRLLPEGGDDEADCYYRGEKVAHLRIVETDGKLAKEIKSARLDRARELNRLRKSLLRTADRMLGKAPCAKDAAEVPILLPPPENSSESEEAIDLPKLETEEDT